MSEQETTMASVLIEHAFHMVTPVNLDDPNGPWQVECNCTADPIQGPSFLAAEVAFAVHQADMLSTAGFGLVAEAKADALKSAAIELMDVTEHDSRMPGIRFAVGFLAGQRVTK